VCKTTSAIVSFNFKIPVTIALLLFISSGVSFLLKKESLADSLAFISFYFLVLAAIFMIIQQIKEEIQKRR